MSSRFPLLAALTTVAALVLYAVLYWPGLQGGFFFDDEPNILQIEALRLHALTQPSIREALASGVAGPSGRPIPQLTFALNHYFGGGFDPFIFKATNLVIHAMAGILVLFLGLRLLSAVSPQVPQGRVRVAASVLAALWLLHPLQLTAVLYVVQRMTSLSALFLFAALLLHVRGRETGGYSGVVRLALAWGLFWPLSFLSKETGALFPLFALLWEIILRRKVIGRVDRFALVLAGLAGLTLVAGVTYFLLPAGQWLWAGYTLRDFSLLERVLTEGRVLWLYLGLILLPRLEAFGLHHDDIGVSTGPLAPWTTLPAWVALAGLVWLAWRVRTKAPMVSFGIAWFLVGHLLESTVLPLELVHEHRNYVPLFGILLALASFLPQALAAPGLRKTLGVTLAAAALGYCAFVTALRAHQFGEETRRSQIEVQHHPASARAHYEAGRAMARLASSADAKSPAYFFARTYFERAGELDGSLKLGWLGLVFLTCRTGTPVAREWIDELARRLEETPFAPGDSTAMYALKEMEIAGSPCLARSDIERLFAAARSNPTVSPHVRSLLHSWLADYLALGARDLPAAEIELDRALAIAPHNPSNRLKRAQLDFLLGRYAAATQRLNELGDAPLVRSERETLAQLRACLASGDPAAHCAAK